VQAFPHHYGVTVAGVADGDVELTAERLTILRSASPAEFDGPGSEFDRPSRGVEAKGRVDVIVGKRGKHQGGECA